MIVINFSSCRQETFLFDKNRKTLQEIIDFLEQNFPTIKSRICNEDGEIRNFVNIYVNDEDVRFLNGISSEIKDGDEISIVPAVAGGSIK